MELRHVLGRAGTFHLFFSFQFLPLWTGLSTLGNNMGGGGVPGWTTCTALLLQLE